MTGPDTAAERAVALMDLGRTDDALRVAATALGAAPDDPALLCIAGVCHLRREESQQALSLFRAAAAVEPEHPEPHRLMSAAMSALGDHPGALTAARELIRITPDNVAARIRWAQCLAEFPHHRIEALENAHWVLHQRPEDPEAHLLLAGVLAKPGRRARGDLSTAGRAVDRAAALSPGSARVELVRATVNMARRRPGAAVRNATDAVLLDPADATTHRVATQMLRILVLLPYASLALVVLFGSLVLYVALAVTLGIALAYVVAVRRRRWAFAVDFFRRNRLFAIAEAMLWIAAAWLFGSSAVGAPVWVPGAGAVLAVAIGSIAVLRGGKAPA